VCGKGQHLAAPSYLGTGSVILDGACPGSDGDRHQGVWSPSSRFAWDLTPVCKGVRHCGVEHRKKGV
jgi:hypothetical protein